MQFTIKMKTEQGIKQKLLIRLLMVVTGCCFSIGVFSQESAERMAYYKKYDFPTKKLIHQANLFVKIPYHSATDGGAPFVFTFQTDANADLCSKITEVLQNTEHIERVETFANGNLIDFKVTSNKPIERKAWAAGLYYSLGFESVHINTKKVDIIHYVQSVRHK